MGLTVQTCLFIVKTTYEYGAAVITLAASAFVGAFARPRRLTAVTPVTGT
jgi:hypothetical protein